MNNDFPLVEVIWFDAYLESSHMEAPAAKAHEAKLRRNVGYLLVNDENKVTITMGLIEDIYHGATACDGVFVFPKGCVQVVHTLLKD